jgi:hypothetical protein
VENEVQDHCQHKSKNQDGQEKFGFSVEQVYKNNAAGNGDKRLRLIKSGCGFYVLRKVQKNLHQEKSKNGTVAPLL